MQTLGNASCGNIFLRAHILSYIQCNKQPHRPSYHEEASQQRLPQCPVSNLPSMPLLPTPSQPQVTIPTFGVSSHLFRRAGVAPSAAAAPAAAGVASHLLPPPPAAAAAAPGVASQWFGPAPGVASQLLGAGVAAKAAPGVASHLLAVAGVASTESQSDLARFLHTRGKGRKYILARTTMHGLIAGLL